MFVEWTRYTTAGERGEQRRDDVVELGPGEVAGLDRKLLGNVDGLRILDIGTGVGHSAIALAKQGAKVIAIDSDATQIGNARAHAEAAEVHVEFHQSDPAELAFLQADIFDAAISVHALAACKDLGRVFRQVHRVLKAEKPLVLTLPHPAALMVDQTNPSEIISSYAEEKPLGKDTSLTYRHGTSTVFTTLSRSNYRVDQLIEPSGGGLLPASLILRARKVGS